MPRKTPKSEQSKLFIEKAREIGCDDGADDEIMRRLASQERRAPPAPSKKPKTKKAAK